MPEPMSRMRRFAYTLGNAGFQVSDRIVVVIAIFYYLPPGGRDLDLVPQVREEMFLGALTVFGLAMLVGRVIDAIADPLVAHASDRSRSPLGRRRSFLIYGVGPMVLIPILLFFPPGPPGGTANAVWLTVLLSLYFIFFTVYVAPYLALIPEIALSQKDRMDLSTILGLVAIPVLIVFGFGWAVGFDAGRAMGLDGVTSIRVVVIASSVLGFLLCLAPILAVDERRFARSIRSDLSISRAIATTLRSRPFLIYLSAQIFFVFGVTLIQPALPYYATVVLGRDPGWAAWLSLAMVGGMAVGFATVRPVVARFGPKRVMLASVMVFAIGLGALGLLRADVPGGPEDARNLRIALAALALVGLPIVAFTVVPNVLISQLIDADERLTGANRSAMFFGVQGFTTKWVYGVAGWVFTVLLARFGNSPDEPLGVILVGPVAAVACLLSVGLYAFYPQAEVLAAAAHPEIERARAPQ